MTEDDTPGVVAPPPLIYLGFLLLGVALDYAWPIAVIPDGLQYAAGAALMVASGVIAITAIRQFRAAGTSFHPHKPDTALITGGLFRVSRNPLYIGLSLLYAGIGTAADNLWVLALLVPTLAVIRYGVIAREERYLEARFGEDYLRYKASVRRWL